jgi:AAA domain, putative AbiEii toxin, Type IV TA system/AAA domain
VHPTNSVTIFVMGVRRIRPAAVQRRRAAMIEAITIHGLRGIRDGTLEGLSALTVLTGVNGCGKSTVLDALLIVGSSRPEEAIGNAVQRRAATRFGARWLVHNKEPWAEIEARYRGNERHRCVLRWRRAPVPLPESDSRRDAVHKRYTQHVDVEVKDATFDGTTIPASSGTGWVAFDGGNEHVASGKLEFGEQPTSWLVDPGLPILLDRAYSEATRLGRREEIIAVLRELVPDLSSVEILSEDDGSPALYVVQGQRGALPIGVAGDGVQALVQLATEFAALPGGSVLVEEPEVYQHPAALRLTARVLLATMRRGVQVILTTHSLELIDMLVEEAKPEDVPQMSLFILALEDGVLRSGRLAGPQIQAARADVAEDLR